VKFDKKSILAGAAVVAVVCVAAGTAIALSGNSETRPTGDPVPGTYSQIPREIGTHEIEFADDEVWPLLITGEALVYFQDPTGSAGRSLGKKMTGVNLETAQSWEYMMEGAYCGSSEMYSQDATMVVCRVSGTDTTTILNPKDGSTVASIPSLQGNDHVAGDTLYTCWREDGTFKLAARKAPDFTEELLVRVPANTENPCNFSLHGDKIAIYSNQNWVTVVEEDGTIVYQDFQRQGSFNSAGLLETMVYNSEEPLEDKTFDVIDLDGKKIFEYSEPFEEVPSIPGGRDSGLFIDEYGAVRERSTGRVRWTYAETDHFRVVGLAGNTLLVVENSERLRAYDAENGAPLWAISVDSVLPDDAESLPGNPGGYSLTDRKHRVAGDGEVLLFASGTRLTAVDVATGDILWNMGTGGWIVDEYQDYIVLSDDERMRVLHFQ
jgi:outer membrane protein assembly factor BamB